MTYLPTFSELYVVSDIHLGGRRDEHDNFQIFNRGERLGNLARYIAEQRVDEDIALVLNGDIIDSLAEDEVPGYIAADSGTALRMMDHLYQDDSFRPVWDSWGHFVRTPRRHLVFVVGNHDIELALPVVENSIREHLAGDDESAQARLHFATHGSGFGCHIAGARIFCTHGNELDKWNWVDYSMLGQLANAINAGRTVEMSKWKPNAGTRLVVDVMNAVKRRYPFVDLLKPEVAAVAAVLLALDKDVFKHIDLEELFPLLRDKRQGELVTKNLLGPTDMYPSEAPAPVTADEASVQLLGPNLREAIQDKRKGTSGTTEDELLYAAERAVSEGKSAPEMAASESAPETLGAWDIISGWLGLVSKEEGLRKALKDWLKDDTTFEVDKEDEYFQTMKERVSDQVDFVITGHSHKPRALKFDGNRYYFNCGTWIRTLRLTGEVLDDEGAEAFEKNVWPALTSGKMEDLDEAKIPGPEGKMIPLLYDRTNVVKISSQDNTAVGELLRVTDGKEKGSIKLDPEPHTNPFKAG